MEAKTTVQFYDPLFVYIGASECNDVHEMLARWKTGYLTDERIKIWNHPRVSKSRFPNVIKWLIFIPRHFWPLIILTVAGVYLPSVSVCFASIILLLVQIVISVSFAAKMWEAMCVVSALELEKRHESKPE